MKKGMIFFVVIVLIISLSFYLLYRSLIPSIKQYGQYEIQRLNQLIVSHCAFTNESQYSQLVVIERDENNNIQLIDFDMVKVNQLASSIVFDLQQTYASLEEGTYQAVNQNYYERKMAEVSKKGIVTHVPLSLFNQNYIFASIPIPLKYKQLSQITNSISKNIQNYGMNHVLIELNIQLHMRFAMVYPFFIQYPTQNITIPVLLEIFEGQIPLYYSNSQGVKE